MYLLIGIIVAFLVLATSVAVPGNSGLRNERPRGRRVPGDAGGAQEAAFAPDELHGWSPR